MLTTRTPRRTGFTLVELLTVIGIISLLIGILLPSLSRARDQAKRLRVQAQVSAVEKGLELFYNDFRNYPDSSYGQDIIRWSAGYVGNGLVPPDNGQESFLSGAHWLARALTGHDFGGVDSRGVMLERRGASTVDFSAFRGDTATPGQYSERKGTYLDAPVFARDDDTKFINATSGTFRGPSTRRLVVIDGYNFPILYYRANPRARLPFQTGQDVQINGVYNQGDNAMLTGGLVPTGGSSEGWDFAGANFRHGLGWFGQGNANTSVNANNIHEKAPSNTTPPYRGKGFADFVHDENAHEAGGAMKAQLPESFLLVSPGKDGVYGSDDDVTNIKGGGL